MAAAAKAALEPWQTAAPRKRSATRRPQRRELEARGHETEPEADTKIVLRRLREAENDLLISAFWSSAVESISRCLTEQLGQQKPPVKTLSEAFGNLHLDSPLGESDVAHASSPGEPLVSGTCRVKCVCYGIGNFATCITARTQLAFLLLFLDKCQTPRSHCWVYDPLFSPLEIAVLHTLGVTVLSENEEGKRSVCGEPTIFYMLHCGTALYNNLLWSNWSVDALSRMVIIGNSFRGLEERLLTRILQKNYPYIAKILEGLDEVEFPQTSEYMDTFNDTSVHWFPTQKLERLPRDLWMFQEEPDYQGCEDLEIIRKTTDPPTADMNPV
ncbi:SRR1-like protein isoform X2 [Heterocephalus glaber]|uniref:SRR1-like protein isoform X2 n=1 Tax=Heterocephalus glaber TaxID=10181 RepID=A0AAX6P3Z3_HETGA|nr:SRR1-like protein isoform X2 [Heterocephalus glaber]